MPTDSNNRTPDSRRTIHGIDLVQLDKDERFHHRFGTPLQLGDKYYLVGWGRQIMGVFSNLEPAQTFFNGFTATFARNSLVPMSIDDEWQGRMDGGGKELWLMCLACDAILDERTTLRDAGEIGWVGYIYYGTDGCRCHKALGGMYADQKPTEFDNDISPPQTKQAAEEASLLRSLLGSFRSDGAVTVAQLLDTKHTASHLAHLMETMSTELAGTTLGEMSQKGVSKTYSQRLGHFAGELWDMGKTFDVRERLTQESGMLLFERALLWSHSLLSDIDHCLQGIEDVAKSGENRG